MKYKSSELELPPLGEIIVIRKRSFNEDQNTCIETFLIGNFYITSEKERDFETFTHLHGPDLILVPYLKGKYKWAFLPKFKSVKEERPPIGIDVLWGISEIGSEVGFLNSFKVFHLTNGKKTVYIKNNFNDKIEEVEMWLPLEAFDED